MTTGIPDSLERLSHTDLIGVARPRYGRLAKDGNRIATSVGVAGHRHGSRTRMLTGTFGRTEIAVPRARLMQSDGGTREWKSEVWFSDARRNRPCAPLV
jgi:putative transposase